MSYCLNPTCRKPENPGNAKFCQMCGSRLLLGDRYRALKLIGQGGFGRTFLAVDEGRAFSIDYRSLRGDDSLETDEQRSSPRSAPHSGQPIISDVQSPAFDFQQSDQSFGDQSSQSTDSGLQRLPADDRSLCVIKQLFPRNQGVDPQKAAELFRQEAERLAELGKHSQIPALLAQFELEDAQYLVQEYIEGQNLEEVLKTEGTFGELQIRDLLADILPVLRFIHSRQVIHRDIKPENIIRPYDRHQFVLVDFGASKYATATALARTGTVIGSAGYVAPEQAMGKAEFASDLYSLGVTCIHLLTGIHPFDLYSVSEDTWVWRQYLPKPISSRLRRVLDKLLQKPTSQRYRSATEVLEDLGLESKTMPAGSKTTSAFKPRQPTKRSRSTRSQTASEGVWRCVKTLSGHEGVITSLAISPGGRILVSGSSDKSIKFWSLETGELLHTFAGRSLWAGSGHSERISVLAVSSDGETLASGSEDGTIKWWDLVTEELIYTLPGYGWGISAIAFSPKGYILACGSSDGLTQLWDLDTEELIADLPKHQDQVSALIFDPQRPVLISSSYDKTIRLWDLRANELIKTLAGHVDRISAIVLSPDNRTLVSGSWDKMLKIWDLDHLEQRKVIAAHSKPITCLAMHPSGKFFASGSEDSTIKLWDLETGDRLCRMKSFWGIKALAFTPDGELLISGGADELIKFWRRG